jgi:hypothetical protein
MAPLQCREMKSTLLGAMTAAALAFAACRLAPPVNYPIPPGASASFNPTQLALSREYAQTFCSVLEKEFSSEGWSSCGKYLKIDQTPPAAQLTELPTNWMLLLVGGFGSQCYADKVPVFGDAADHLRRNHQLESVPISVAAFDSSESNAKQIVAAVGAIENQTGKNLIAIAHSKGAADWMVALAAYPTQLKRVKALITVAGAVGGSWLADDFQVLNDKLIKHFADLPTCQPPRLAPRPNGIDSMRRENRQKFLAETNPTIPAYSISAVADCDVMSQILKPLWRRLLPYALEEDSHIVEREAIVPWGQFLGRALGDHWAVAMPFEKATPPTAPHLIDHNHYPRSALLEAAVRIAIQHTKIN